MKSKHGKAGAKSGKDHWNYKHGQGTKRKWTPEYRAWTAAKRRCYNPNYRNFQYWGGRGIIMCNGLVNDYQAFFDVVGQRPSKKHSIDRIDNDKNYSCGKCNHCVDNGWLLNVRWATDSEQQLNQRRQKYGILTKAP